MIPQFTSVEGQLVEFEFELAQVVRDAWDVREWLGVHELQFAVLVEHHLVGHAVADGGQVHNHAVTAEATVAESFVLATAVVFDEATVLAASRKAGVEFGAAPLAGALALEVGVRK